MSQNPAFQNIIPGHHHRHQLIITQFTANLELVLILRQLWLIDCRVGRFLPEGEKNRFFHGKNRTGKNSFCRQKIGFCQNIFFNTFITIKYCCTAYIILTSISAHFKFSVFLLFFLFDVFYSVVNSQYSE